MTHSECLFCTLRLPFFVSTFRASLLRVFAYSRNLGSVFLVLFYKRQTKKYQNDEKMVF